MGVLIFSCSSVFNLCVSLIASFKMIGVSDIPGAGGKLYRDDLAKVYYSCLFCAISGRRLRFGRAVCRKDKRNGLLDLLRS